MSVARPKILGPSTDIDTLPTARRPTRASIHRSGAIRARSRRADGQKFNDFSTGRPILRIGPPPRPCSRMPRAAAFVSRMATF